MTKPRVVSDAGPLIAFAGIRRLELLERTYGLVAIPENVAHEIRPSIPEIPSWIVVEREQKMSDIPIRHTLDAGERAAIDLALALAADLLLIDDLKGREAALDVGLEITGSVGVVVAAKRLGLITIALPVIDQLRDSGLFLSDRVYQAVLANIGE